MKAVIFVGPSIPLGSAREILDAIYLPPARQSDLISAVGLYQPDVIGLIDGEFGQALSVWHKEILYVMEQGIPVFGASSMGALRAAEVAEFGMVGVGEIFRAFASGELTDDDEVALTYSQDESGYRPLSEPMVNIRATFRRARDAGVIDDGQTDALLQLAKQLFFPERTFARILRDALAVGIPASVLERLEHVIACEYVDLKRLDAAALLRAIRDLPQPVPRHSPSFRLERSNQFETLFERDRRVRHDGMDIPLASIANRAALHCPDFAELNAAALNRALVGVLGEILDVSVSSEDVAAEERRFRIRRHLTDDGAFRAWQANNDLSAQATQGLMRQLAMCRQLQQWLVGFKFTERSVRPILDELRLRGLYEDTAHQAALQERLLREQYPHFAVAMHDDVSTESLVLEHMRATACRMDTSYDRWSEETGFHTPDDLRIELLRARLARRFIAGVADHLTPGSAAPAPDAAAAGR